MKKANYRSRCTVSFYLGNNTNPNVYIIWIKSFVVFSV